MRGEESMLVQALRLGKYVAAFMAFIVLLDVQAQDGDPTSAAPQDPDAQVAKRFRKVIASLADFWPPELRIPANQPYGRTRKVVDGEPRFQFVTRDPRISVDLDPSSELVFFLYYQTLVDRARDMARSKKQMIPTWSREEAVRRGQDVLAALYGSVPQDIQFAPHRPAFGFSDTDPGTWWVEWDQTIDGYSCYQGGLLLRLHEVLGVYSFSDGRRFDACPTEVNISREAALAEARAAAEEASRRYGSLFCGTGLGALLDRPVSLMAQMAKNGLVIVNPDWTFGRDGRWPENPRTDPMVDFRNPQRRLAYVFEFSQSVDGVADERDPPTVRVLVDAADGTILGGDFTLR